MRIFCLLAFAITVWPSASVAQSDPASPPLSVPEATSPGAPGPATEARPATLSCSCEEKGAYRHDGLYVRYALGATALFLWGTGPRGHTSLSGLGSGLTIAVGGTPSKGLVIGGIAMAKVASTTSFDGGPVMANNGPLPTAQMLVTVVGLLADWYPDPTRGWHVGASLGIGEATLTDSLGTGVGGPAFGGSLLGGHDWWIGPQWALGAMVVATTATSITVTNHGREGTYSLMPASIGLELTLVFH